MKKRAVELALAGAEKVYGAGVRAIHWGFRRGILKKHRLPVKVISVGNLTWGGTGKTPLVIHLAQALQSRGHRVAVLTRGYGQDESKLMTERLAPIPVLVGPDRVVTGAQAVREHGADLLLLDDGYQQWRLQKDLEILTADAEAPFGNGRLIPLGNLREPPAAAARADLIVLKGKASAGTQAQMKQLNPGAPIFFMTYEPHRMRRWPDGKAVPLKNLKGRKVCTMAGIGDPKQFEQTVASLEADIRIRHRAQDHHRYTAGELIRLVSRCRRHGVRTVVTTEKDAVRIPNIFRETAGRKLEETEFWVIEIKPRFEPDESELLHRIHTVLAR